MLVETWGVCPEEQQSHGILGIIKDTEWLFRFVDLGNDVDEKNCIALSGLKSDEFIKTDGWSFYRKDYVADILRALNIHAAKKGGKRYGYVLIQAGVLRQIRDEEQRRAVCVIDNPEPDDPEPLDPVIAPAHALACPARKYTKSDAKEIRNRMLAQLAQSGEVKTE